MNFYFLQHTHAILQDCNDSYLAKLSLIMEQNILRAIIDLIVRIYQES